MKLIAVMVLWILVAQESRAPVPTPEEQARIEKSIREVFKDEYVKKTPAVQTALANSLITQARETKDDLTARYVLLREAADVAARAGLPQIALTAVDELLKSYQADPVTTRQVILGRMEPVLTLPEDLQALSEAWLKVVDEASATEQWGVATKAAQASVSAAKRAKDLTLASRADLRLKSIVELRASSDRARKAEQTLVANPEDAAANSVVGENLCFGKGNWEKGLSFLCRGSDAALRALAAKDLALPSELSKQVEVGDGWWELADKDASAPRKHQLLGRAAYWYALAQPGASGLLKVKLEKRLLEAETATRGKLSLPPGLSRGIDLLAMINLAEDTSTGVWQFDGKVFVSPMDKWAFLQVPYIPPDEYDLALEVEKSKGDNALVIGLVSGASQFNASIDGWAGDFTGLDLLDGRSGNMNETRFHQKFFQIGKTSHIACSVRREGVTLLVDGVKAVEWKGNPRRLTLWKDWRTKRNDTLFLGSFEASFIIRKVTLVEISGKGRQIR